MARVKLSEFRAKTLLSNLYNGVQIRTETIAEDIARLSDDNYVIKVDQGIKKRGKQGLLVFNVEKDAARSAVDILRKKGPYTRFLAEPMMKHDNSDEQYLSIERGRGGFTILHSKRGGIEVEDHASDIKMYTQLADVPLSTEFLTRVIDVMNHEHLSFVEINPLVVQGDQYTLLDAAVLADSAGSWQASWDNDDIVELREYTDPEEVVAELGENSAASFSLRVLNPDGAIWLLLSGGGASITIADEAANQQKADLIGNYGEYSGGPTREETQVYTEAVLEQLLASNASKKALVIAGGVANFTDVRKTFSGIIDALTKQLEPIKSANVKVYVRRGGPNEKEGLAAMRTFLNTHGILGSVHGSETILTDVINEALEYVDA